MDYDKETFGREYWGKACSPGRLSIRWGHKGGIVEISTILSICNNSIATNPTLAIIVLSVEKNIITEDKIFDLLQVDILLEQKVYSLEVTTCFVKAILVQNVMHYVVPNKKIDDCGISIFNWILGE